MRDIKGLEKYLDIINEDEEIKTKENSSVISKIKNLKKDIMSQLSVLIYELKMTESEGKEIYIKYTNRFDEIIGELKK